MVGKAKYTELAFVSKVVARLEGPVRHPLHERREVPALQSCLSSFI